MKKIILLSMLLIPSLLYSQNVINGIGKIKLGCDTTIISELGYVKEPIKVEKNSSAYFSKVYGKYNGDDCFLITPPKSAPSTDKYVEYYIPLYSPINSVNLKGISLSFYDGILYKIQISNPDGLKEAFDEKYGEHEIELKEEEKHYTNGFGAKITKIDKRFLLTWNTNDNNISCTETLSTYHNSKGEKNTIRFFLIYKNDISEKVRNENEAVKEKVKEEEKTKKFGDIDKL